MCCCCPPAITALFCLWVQSGFSKGSVAGALTFFPPEPALYKFERRDKDGNILEDEIDDDDEDLSDNLSPEEEDELALATDTPPASVSPLEAVNNKEKSSKKPKSPAAQLTEHAQALRRRAKLRNARDAKDAKRGVKYTVRLDPRVSSAMVRGCSVEALKLPSSRGAHIATLVYRVPPDHVTPLTKTIIYSHGNATDIGAMHDLLVILVHSLDSHVVSYDYSGYGESGGVPMESNTYQDIATVYDYTRKYVASGGKESNIVLYGQSVGSGPSCHLCCRNFDVGGLILHSPFTSGMRVLTPSRALACLDIYPNINRIKRVKCPVMVIHGRLDEEVDISHGRAMHNAVPSHLQRDPWWVPDRGHNDIVEGPGKMAEYLRRLRAFLTQLDE